jgi:hypothetical protein
MKSAINIILPALFIFNGCVFLLIGTVFYPAIFRELIRIQEQSTILTPDFWDLATVLEIVRIIFIIIGVFLTGFGIAMAILRKRWALWS